MRSDRQSQISAALQTWFPVAVAAFLLFAFIGKIPGLHGDETWNFVLAKRIAGGLCPLSSANSYTGPFFQIILAPLFEIFGYRVWVMRGAAALLNLAGLFCALGTARRLFPGQRAPVFWFGMLLATFPLYVGFSRFAIELTAVNPFLFQAGLYLVVIAVDRHGLARFVAALASGICWGLAVNTHVVSLTFPLGLILALVIVFRGKLLKSIVFWLSLAGAALPVGLRVFQIMIQSAGRGALGDRVGHLQEMLWLTEAPYLPRLLIKLTEGAFVYQRFCGRSWVNVIPYVSVALIILTILTVVAHRRIRFHQHLIVAALCLAFSLALTWVIAPTLSLRYFQFPLFAVPLILSMLYAGLPDGRVKKIARAVLLTLVLLSSGYLAVNYFASFLTTRGKRSTFKLGIRLGGQLRETSNHFLRTDRLYERLTVAGVKHVLTNDAMIANPLKTYDMDKNRLTVRAFHFLPYKLPETTGPPSSLKTAVVIYKEINPRPEKRIEGFTWRERPFALQPGFDRHFYVYFSTDGK